MKLPPIKSSIDLLGRLFLVTTFAIAIPPKILEFESVVNSINNKGIPSPFSDVLLVCAIILLVAGIGNIVFGKDQKIGATLLLIFLVPTTLIMHFFPFQSLAVFMNMGLIGGLIILFSRDKPNK